MARFSVTQVPEAIQPLWTALQAGEFVADAAAQVGTHRTPGAAFDRGMRRRSSAP